MHSKCNTRHSLCTLVRNVPPAEAKGREREAARPPDRELPDDCRTSGDARRATRLHADAGCRGARRESIDLRSAVAAVARNRRHAVGHAARSRRRARAVREGATRARPRAHSDGAAGETCRRSCRARAAHPGRECQRQEPPPDRPRAQRHRDADRPRRRAMVAINRARRPATSPTREDRISGARLTSADSSGRDRMVPASVGRHTTDDPQRFRRAPRTHPGGRRFESG